MLEAGAETVNDALFDRLEAERFSLTYDDIKLETRASDFDPDEVDITTHFSRNVALKTPFVSAAMDTITESKMAIAMATMGGIGVIHARLSPDDQRHEVKAVKLHLNGLIEEPITVRDDSTLGEFKKTTEKWHFKTFPVVDSNGKFVGLVTEDDIDFAGTDSSRPLLEVMTPAARVIPASGQISVKEAYDQMLDIRKKMLPIIAEDGTVAGLYVWSDVSRIVEGNDGLFNTDRNGRLVVAAAVPTDEEAFVRMEKLKGFVDVVVIDTAQGDSKHARGTLAQIKQLRETYPDIDIVVGNICNPASAKQLADLGADGVKIGQGPGSICSTGEETGSGLPQLSSVFRCARILRGLGIPVCADGGIRKPAHFNMAITAGADTMMLGRMLAGTKENPVEARINEHGQLVVPYEGMASPRHIKTSKRYLQASGALVPQGVEAEVEYRGTVIDLLRHYINSLRIGMSYDGVGSIADSQRHVSIWRKTQAGTVESTPHVFKS